MSFNKETQMYEGYIYMIENDINHKKYIGQTMSTLEDRFRGHKYSQHKSILNMAMKKYGREHFHIQELEHNNFKTKEELKKWLNQKEIYYISLYQTFNTDNGYNATPGGDSGSIYFMKKVDVYDITGTFITEFESCYAADRYYDVCLGSVGQICIGKIIRLLKFPELVFRFHGEAFDKYPLESETLRIIYQYTLNGEQIGIYRSFYTPKLKYNLTTASLREALKHKKMLAGYYWSCLPYFDNQVTYLVGIPVDQYSLDGQYIATYLSASEASIAVTKNHIPKQNDPILKCCRGERSYTSGYVWRFRGEPFNKFAVDLQLSYYKPVDQFTKDGTYVASFINANEAARKLGKINGSHILAACNGERKTAYGYIWKHSLNNRINKE